MVDRPLPVPARRAGRVVRIVQASTVFANVILFQAAWFTGVLGAASGRPWLGPLAALAVVAWHLARAKRALPEALLLGAAGLLRGYRAAVHWGAREALSQFGAEPSDERVCVDRNRLTGGGITAGVDFGITVAGKWAGEGMGRVIELIMEYAPQPPYGSGRPELADAQTLAAARAAMHQAMTGVPA